MAKLKSNSFSHLTAKDRKSQSFPSKILEERGLLNGEILDFGCGLGMDVKKLKTKGYNIEGYDPYYNNYRITKKFDTILCIYVLNVLFPEEQSNVIMDISSYLKPSGKAFFAVRRDIKYEGFRNHRVHKKNTYQCIVNLPFSSIFKNDFVEIYSYQHYTERFKNRTDISPFLKNQNCEIILESATVISIFDKYPVNPGHCLIIPKRLVSNFFDLTFKEQNACFFMIRKLKNIIQKKFNPDGFNIGVNIDESAGQSVPHVHIHLIPRYKGDIENPLGGVRGVIPEKRLY